MISAHNTPIKKNTIQSLQLPEILEPTQTNHTVDTTTTKQTKMTPTPYQPVPDNRSEYSWDTLNTDDNWEPENQQNKFGIIHSLLYQTIEEWTTEPSAKQNAFYAVWIKAKYLGLNPLTEKEKAFTILKTPDYGSYILCMQRCPKIRTTYTLEWDTYNDLIRYHTRQLPTEEELERDTTKLQKLHQQLKTPAYTFESKMQTMNTQLDTLNTKLIYHQQAISSQVEKGSHQLTTLVQKHSETHRNIGGTSKQTNCTNAIRPSDQDRGERRLF
jgi:hypothetical protein